MKIKLKEVTGKTGIVVDGDWVESKDQDINGDVRLIQLADIGQGKFLDRSARFLTRETAKKLNCTYLKEGDILIARMPDPIGRACVFPNIIQPCVTVVDVCVVRVDPDFVDNRWLMWILNSPHFRFQLTPFLSGTTRQRISRKNLESLKISLPPIASQRRIANILDKADEIIRKRKEAIALTEQLLKSTFLDMFGDPVINPKGWEIKPLNSFGKILTGNTPPRADIDNYGDHIEWIKSDNITIPEHFLSEATEKLSTKGKKLGRVVPKDSILVTCIAGSKSSIGRAGLADREVAFNQQINAIIPNSEINPFFLYSHFFVFQNLVQEKSTDSMKGMVNKTEFSNIEFMKPPKEDQEKFGDFFKNFHRYYKSLKIHLQESENLFNSLLQKAFKGEL